MEARIPESLKSEHEHLYAALNEAILRGGKTGAAAKSVAKIFYPHIMKEEAFAMPPLSLLRSLSEDKTSPDMVKILGMVDKLKAEIRHLFDEHKAIMAELNRLIESAREEGNVECVQLAEKIIQHARIEEEILYPAAMLVGDLVIIKFLG